MNLIYKFQSKKKFFFQKKFQQTFHSILFKKQYFPIFSNQIIYLSYKNNKYFHSSRIQKNDFIPLKFDFEEEEENFQKNIQELIKKFKEVYF